MNRLPVLPARLGRRTLAVVAALATALTLASPADAATRKYTVSIKTSSSTVGVGSPVTISGSVSPRTGGTVAVQLKTSSWSTQARVPVSSSGTYAYTFRPTSGGTRDYRVAKASSSGVSTGYSATKRITVLKKKGSIAVTTPSPSSAEAGTPFTISGRVSSTLGGRTVYLQQKTGTASWTTIGSAKSTEALTFSVAGRITAGGRGKQVRIYAPATGSTATTYSAVRAVDVFAWYFLADRDQAEGYFLSGSESINGTRYSQTVYKNRTGDAEWNLARKCTRFRAVAGVLDDSVSASRYDSSVAADDTTVWSRGNFTLGATPSSIDVNVTNALRLKLRVKQTASYSSSWLGFGDARIRCAF